MYITENFTKEEFDSSDGVPMPQKVFENIIKLANQLQFVRNYTGKAIKINSGYRSPKHNMSAGGVKNSQHVKGTAADIVISGMLPSETYELLEKLIKSGRLAEGGLGRYNTFTHYDIRGYKSRWDKT